MNKNTNLRGLRRRQMNKEQFDALYLCKAVHCKTDELADEFLELASKFGYYITVHNYNRFKENTCYRLNDGVVEYCYLDWYRKQGYEIIEFKSVKSNNDDGLDALNYVMNGILDEVHKQREIRTKQWEQFFTGKTMTIPQMQHTLPHIKIVRREEKTLLEKILEEVGITIGVEFNIKYTEANCAPKNKFRYEKNVGAQQLINGKWVDAHWLWYKLISGKAKVVKTPLLTDAEREFLKNFEFEELIKDNANIALRKKDRLISLHIIELKYCKYKFNGLEDYKPFIKDSKTYTRDELGL